MNSEKVFFGISSKNLKNKGEGKERKRREEEKGKVF